MSIRFKILILLLVLTLGSLGSYFFVAQKVFKEDKTAYVYDSAMNSSQTTALLLRQKILSSIEQSQSILQSHDQQQPVTSANPAILFIAIAGISPDSSGSGKSGKIEWKKILEKDWHLDVESWSTSFGQFLSQKDSVRLIRWGANLVLMIKNTSVNLTLQQGTMIILKSAFFESDLNQAGFLSAEVLSDDGALLLGTNPSGVDTKIWQQQLETQIKKSAATGSFSSLVENGKEKYLISATQVGVAGLWVVSSIPQTMAFRSLNLLLEKSIYFVLLLVSLTVFLSFISARAITGNLSKLLEATKKITGGNFQVELKIPGRDEFGKLSEAFVSMSKEISRLIQETVEKTRMESELKTAQTVQQTLFPENDFLKNDRVELAGLYSPASECGGDWWFYFQRESKLYVVIADATGHGAPAALMTAAARSVFTTFETRKPKDQFTLEEMTSALNEAIRMTSKSQILMTAMLLEIDFETRKLSYINCSHEPLLKITAAPDKKNCEYFMEPNNFRIGQQSVTEYQRASIDIAPGDLLFLYTDGLTNQKNEKDKEFGDRRLTKILTASDGNSKQQISAQSLNSQLMSQWQEHRGNTPPEDDVTLVALRIL